MIVPNEVIFGPNAFGEGITYGYLRKVTDETELIRLLRLRLDRFFIQQTQPLQQSRSAFPLALMTCIGIETLGQVLVQENNDDSSFQFVEVARKVHQVFGRKPSKDVYKRLSEIWNEKDISKMDSNGKILYRFFRNTMVHGYQAKGVFLSYEDLSSIEIDTSSGFLKLNPDWFWERFKVAFEKLFSEVENAEDNNPMRQHCLWYIREFLLE